MPELTLTKKQLTDLVAALQHATGTRKAQLCYTKYGKDWNELDRWLRLLAVVSELEFSKERT